MECIQYRQTRQAVVEAERLTKQAGQTDRAYSQTYEHTEQTERETDIQSKRQSRHLEQTWQTDRADSRIDIHSRLTNIHRLMNIQSKQIERQTYRRRSKQLNRQTDKTERQTV